MRGEVPLKALLRILVIIIILCGIGFYWSIMEKGQNGSKENSIGSLDAKNYSYEKRSNKKIKAEGLFQLIGKDNNEVEMELGKPERIDVSAYGYQWWIYKLSKNKYIQIGIENNKVVTIYAIGKDINIKPFYFGQPIGEIYSSYFIESTLDLYYDNQTYHFELSEEDINFRPIIRINTMYVQLYIDKFSGTLSSIRIMDVPTVIKLRPFDYREMTSGIPITNNIDEKMLAKAYEQQIFDITNMIRFRYDLSALKWDEELAAEGYKESKEMFENNLFSIDNKEDATERLKMGMFVYLKPGENIAVHYLDAPAIVEGWYNSEIHRKNLLSEEYHNVGVGVYRNYFTQKFVHESESKDK